MSDFDPFFDVRSDADGRDPDRHSPTLRAAHQFLWSKSLPSGHALELVTTNPDGYLYHRSELGEFYLSSDSIIPTYSYWKQEPIQSLIAELPGDLLPRFDDTGYTIGATTVFPGNMVDRKPTLNQVRGTSTKIADRMDLTLECVRRYYEGDQHTPLGPTIARYDDFFNLFGGFAGYVDFFLLNDLVDPTTGEVKFFLPFDNFERSGLPADVAQYVDSRRRRWPSSMPGTRE